MDALGALIEKLKKLLLIDNQLILPFCLGCGIMGCLAVILDCAYFYYRGNSLLNLKHDKWWKTIIDTILWFVCANIIGYFGVVLTILQMSLFSCVTVGFSWPFIFKKILIEITKGDNQTPSQEE